MSILKNKFISGLTKAVIFPVTFAKLALSRFDSESYLDKSIKEVHSYGRRHEVPDENFPKIGHLIPKHLIDNKGAWRVAPDGQSLATKIHENEVFTGYISPAIPLVYLVGAMLVALNIVLKGIFPSLQIPMAFMLLGYIYFLSKVQGFGTALFFAFCAFPMFGISSLQSYVPGMLAGQLDKAKSVMTAVPFLVSLLPALFIWYQTRRVVKTYYASLANKGFASGGSVSTEINPQRQLQAINSAADKSDIFRFGEALGATARKGDVFGSDEGQDFCASHKDLRTNILTEGASQKGKTAIILKPLARFINSAVFPNENGRPDSIVVACGKNTLTKDFAESGFINTRIHPLYCSLNWINQFSHRPEFITNEIVKAVGGKNQKNDHWTLSGKIAFECSITIHRALIDMMHGNKSQNSYFQTIKDIQLSMAEQEAAKDDPELKKQLKGKTEEEQEEILAQFAQKKKMSIIDKLNGHPDLVNEKSMLSRAVKNYEMIFAKTPEERSGVFSTLAAWIDMFTSNPLLNEWSFVEESEVNFREKTEQGDNISLELAEDEMGPAGPVLTRIMLKFMSSDLINERPIDHNPAYPYFHFFLDEAHLIADDNLADTMSVCLSKRFSYKLAFQMDESILTRFSEAFLATLKHNCHIRVTFDSSEKTLKDFSQNIGTAYVYEPVQTTNSIDLVATTAQKASLEWFDETSEKRSYLKKWFRSTHKYFVIGDLKETSAESQFKSLAGSKINNKPLLIYDNVVKVERSKEPVPIIGMADFTKYFSEKFVFAITAKVGDVVRRDFVRGQPMKNDGTRINVAEANLKKLLEEERRIKDNEKELELEEEGV